MNNSTTISDLHPNPPPPKKNVVKMVFHSNNFTDFKSQGNPYVPKSRLLLIGVPLTTSKNKKITPAVWKSWRIVADKTFELTTKFTFILVFYKVKDLTPLIKRAQELGLVVHQDLPDQVPFQYISSKRDFHPTESALNMHIYSTPIELSTPSSVWMGKSVYQETPSSSCIGSFTANNRKLWI